MQKIAVIYHSTYGHTEKLAQHVLQGAQSVQNTQAKLIKAADAMGEIEYLNSCDAIIFGAPTYMGSLSAEMKKFMEATSKVWLKQPWKNKLAAGFVNSGSPHGDKFNSLLSLIVFAGQHGMIWVSPAQLPIYESEDASLIGVNQIGCYLGVMSHSPNGEGPDKAPHAPDLKTGELLGRHVAETAAKFFGK